MPACHTAKAAPYGAHGAAGKSTATPCFEPQLRFGHWQRPARAHVVLTNRFLIEIRYCCEGDGRQEDEGQEANHTRIHSRSNHEGNTLSIYFEIKMSFAERLSEACGMFGDSECAREQTHRACVCVGYRWMCGSEYYREKC